MKTILLLLFAVGTRALAQIPVTDAANLVNNTILHAENIAKWVESINSLRTQIDQLNRQISIQSDIRQWTGNPLEAGGKLVLSALGRDDLVRDYGKTKAAILGLADSLESLKNTASGSFRAISDLDIDGQALNRDGLMYRRYAVLDGMQANSDEVTEKTRARERELEEDVAVTLENLKAAPTDAEVQKLSAKLTVLNGQLAEADAARRREVDAVTLQKIANDARIEQERLAAAELAARDDDLANRRVSTYMGTLKLRTNRDEK